MDNNEKLPPSTEILNSITNELEKDVILNKVLEYKIALSNEKAKAEELWSTPFVKKTEFWVILAFLIVITITKFCIKHPFLDSGVPPKDAPKNYDYLDLVFYGLWLVGPPSFFLYEYVFYFGKKSSNRLDPKQAADIKYCQDLAGKIWAGLAVFFSILLLAKYGIKF